VLASLAKTEERWFVFRAKRALPYFLQEQFKFYTMRYLHFFRLFIFFTLFTLTQCSKKDVVVDTKPVVEEPPKVILDDKLAHIDIQTKDKVPINSKLTYVAATIAINGKKNYTDFAGSAQIKGRGNSTWSYPKKPYRFKLDEKASLLGLAAEKDWILLANYLDGTHTLNPLALKIGKLLNMPFTNNIIPVEVTLNGQYQGVYMLTEQIELKTNRVNIGKGGVLLQLDKNFDEEWRFLSTAFQLPVQVMEPELTNATELIPIKTQFEQLDSLIGHANFPNNNYLDYFDAEAFANYFIVYMLTDNEELNHPKSIYIYKANGGKFTMGPIWDFDWAYGFQGGQVHFARFNNAFFWSSPSVGTRFFMKILSDPKIKTLVKQKWVDFRANKFNELLPFIDEYALLIEGARNRDYQKWKRGNLNFKSDIATLKTWLQNRAIYTDGYIKSL
jgi:CotH kinase protein